MKLALVDIIQRCGLIRIATGMEAVAEGKQIIYPAFL